MKLDGAILEELERGGPGTVKEIGERLSRRVYSALERLANAEIVIKGGIEGKGNEKLYRLREHVIPDPIPQVKIVSRHAYRT